MATTVDDLIALKDEAIAACAAVGEAWESGNLSEAANLCAGAVEAGELYDAAEEDDDAVSVEDYESGQAGKRAGAKEAATCSGCLARTYRGESCVCEDGFDAGD